MVYGLNIQILDIINWQVTELSSEKVEPEHLEISCISNRYQIFESSGRSILTSQILLGIKI
jgi:hypothetical protein